MFAAAMEPGGYSAPDPLAGTEGAALRRMEEKKKGGRKREEEKDMKKWKEIPKK